MIVATGIGSVVLGGDRDTNSHESTSCDPTPWLKERKTRKYMGLQDEMAVVAVGRALEQAGLRETRAPERTGLYLSVGYIPFAASDIEPVLEASVVDGEFSIARFASDGYLHAHPLLTFRCLPNMPAFHVSANFDIQGTYHVGYPGPGQLYLALERAVEALATREIDVAIVAGVAHQRNFLVEHHFARLTPPADPGTLIDVAGALVLEREDTARSRTAPIVGRMISVETGYVPFDPRESQPTPTECVVLDGVLCASSLLPHAGFEVGPASLALQLDAAWSRSPHARVEHRIATREGIRAKSEWEGIAR